MPSQILNQKISVSKWDEDATRFWQAAFNDVSFTPNTVLDVASGFGMNEVVEVLLQVYTPSLSLPHHPQHNNVPHFDYKNGAHVDGIAHRNENITIQRVMGRGEPVSLPTPLLLAAKAGHLDIVTTLLNNGARKGTSTLLFNSLMYLICYSRR